MVRQLVNNELEGREKKQSSPRSRYYLGIRLEGLRKPTKTLSQYSPSPDQDLNPSSLESGKGMLNM
jgi:hypothetical protein